MDNFEKLCEERDKRLSVKMNIGKYKGKKIRYIIENDAGYCKWYIKKFKPYTDFNEILLKAFEYVDKNAETQWLTIEGERREVYCIGSEEHSRMIHAILMLTAKYKKENGIIYFDNPKYN